MIVKQMYIYVKSLRVILLGFVMVFASTACNKDNNIYSIQNSEITVTINSIGAELISLKKENREYIWQGAKDMWSHHSPILFPIVGGLKDNEFIYKNKTYSLPKHGFASKSDFALKKQSSNELIFELINTSSTMDVYPFAFKLTVTYNISNSSLKTSYNVENLSDVSNMYFSIGAHPAFNCPILKGQNRNEYQLVFDKRLKPLVQMRRDNMLVDEFRQVFKDEGILNIDDHLFDDNALIFSPNPFSSVELRHEPTQRSYLKIDFENFPYLGLWSSLNKESISPFICIEPWYGINDNLNHNKKIEEKKGIIKLLPKEEFNCSYSILIF